MTLTVGQHRLASTMAYLSQVGGASLLAVVMFAFQKPWCIALCGTCSAVMVFTGHILRYLLRQTRKARP